MWDRPSAWKDVFQAFSDEFSLDVKLNRHTGDTFLELVSEDGEPSSISLSLEDTLALVNHLSSALEKFSK